MNSSIRNSVILTLLLILLTQLMFNPWSLSLLFIIMGICLYWSMSREARVFPRKWTFLLTALALGCVFISYGSFLGVDAGVATLSTFLFAKALETRNRRDLIVLFNFALFVCASSFLYSQSMWMAIMVILCLFSCLTGLYRIQTTEFEAEAKAVSAFKQDARNVLKFVAYALPFFILLFMFFPRLPPLWYIPVPDSKGVTGISDRMSPGDIAELSQSSALAFRIAGNTAKLPPRSELYWRAMVLDDYDGQTWTSSFINQQQLDLNQLQQTSRQTEKLHYQYLPADAQTTWVMGLEKSVPATDQYTLHQDWSITPRKMRGQQRSVSLIWVGDQLSHHTAVYQPQGLSLRINTGIPQGLDPQAQKFARSMFEQSGHETEKYIQNVLKWYQTQGFSYTLSPGKLGTNRVDEFLFQQKKGFCEHYASSFSMLMRYVGIPARVVVGYQGGESAPDQQSWEVRQMDAHAWTEVWLNGRWTRYDPTAIIAPQRIDEGMQNLLSSDRTVLGNKTADWKYQQWNILVKMRIWSDYASYQWQSKVVGYDVESQRSWMQKWGIESSYALVMVLIAGVGTILSLYVMWILWNNYRKLDAVERHVAHFSDQLQQEFQRHPAETVSHWLIRLSESVSDHDRNDFHQAANLYLQYKFSSEVVISPSDFIKALKRCSYTLKKQEKTCFKK